MAQTPGNLSFLKILVFQKTPLLLKLIFRATELQLTSKFVTFQKALFCSLVSSTNLLQICQQDSIYDDDELVLWNDWLMKAQRLALFQLGLLSKILTITNLQHPASRIWFKLGSCHNHYTTTPQRAFAFFS